MGQSTERRKEKITYLPAVNKTSRFPRVRLMPVLAVLAVIYFSALFIAQYSRLVQLRHSLQSIEMDIQTVRMQNEEMLKEIERLHSPSYVEQMARQELGMVRPGELLFYLQEADNPPVNQR
jgi:cell division protein FtsL